MARRPNILARLANKLQDNDADELQSDFLKNDLFGEQNFKTKQSLNSLKCLQKYGFSKKTLKLTKNDNLAIKEKFNLTGVEYLVLVPFLNKQRTIIKISHLIKLTKGSDSMGYGLLQACFKMFRQEILQIFPDEGDVQFSLSAPFTEYLKSEEFKTVQKKTLRNVINTIDTIANLYNNFQQYSMCGELEILYILSQNVDYPYCKVMLELYNHCLKTNEEYYKFVFYMIGHLILNNRDDCSISKDNGLIELFVKYNPDFEEEIDKLFLNDDHPLFQEKIFDRSIDESGKADKDTIEIHADFKRKYLQNIIKERRHDDVIKKDKIAEKKMFYNKENEEQIKDLTWMLEKEAFDTIKERLKNSGTRTGFACLFCGYPGVGKTETALQIAKKTGRDIIKVDMASLRSKWWGEDEKNVKAIFTNYRSVLQDARIEPILLLNEADAIIGKRLDVTGNNGAIITSINAVQNIILEELENFEGILIATTNLTQNMDMAFERRFLYKIDFEKPNLENRINLWVSILGISEDDAKILATQFDFTGANIENVFRKKTAKSILYGEQYSLDKLIGYCKEEKIEKDKKIGFGS